MKTLYFSATGNNLYIAKKLGGELLSIPQLIKNNEYEIEDDVVGIVFPVFYANSPNIVREFLKKQILKRIISLLLHLMDQMEIKMH